MTTHRQCIGDTAEWLNVWQYCLQCSISSMVQTHRWNMDACMHAGLKTHKQIFNSMITKCPHHSSRQREAEIEHIYVSKTLRLCYCNEGDFDSRLLMFKQLVPRSRLFCLLPFLLTPSPPSLFSSILLLSSLSRVISAHMLLWLLIVCESFAASWVFQGYTQVNKNIPISSGYIDYNDTLA